MNVFLQYAILIYLLPLVSFGVMVFFGKRLPRKGDWVSVSAILISLVLALSLFASMILNYDPNFSAAIGFSWIDLGAFKVDMGIRIDNLSIVMLLVVTMISAASQIYSLKYMEGDPGYSRYYAYLSLFTFSMNGIVLADNLVLLYMSWELVGLSSYLLIGFWYEKDSAANAGKKAFLANRVGDIGFFIGIMLLFTAIGSFDYSDIFQGVAAGKISGTLLSIAGIGLFMGAVGKSAQVPLHIWLPDAMEGPTPVSALIHAATMVAAGVYMMVRLFPIIPPDALIVVAYVGGITALMAATIAITRTDIKQVLAYSTLSQLGYMILSIGTGAYVAAFFHLLTHAMFKANLFYGAGSVIHSMHHSLHKLDDDDRDPQDMRNMGGFRKKMPLTFGTMLVSTLAISGVPFFSGFLSKDAILAGTLSFASHNPVHFLLPVFGFGAALLTAFYMFRMIFLTFYGKPAHEDIYEHIHESPKEMTAPMLVLGALTFFIFYTIPSFNPFSDAGWFKTLIQARDSLAGGPIAHEIAEGIHHSHYSAMGISLLVAGLGILLAWLMYYKKSLSAEKVANSIKPLYNLSFNKFYFDEIYSKFLYTPFLKLADKIAYIDWDLYDKYFINGFGVLTKLLGRFVGKADYYGIDQTLVDGIGRAVSWKGRLLKEVQTGRLQNYMLFALIGIIILLLVQVF